MNTPIFDFVKKYSESKAARMHMPGHKGIGELGCEQYDITEISGADVLYSADGIINESENNLTALYGTEHSFYSTQGSTLAICAMLFLATKGSKRPRILAARNVHTAFVKAAALLDLEVEWLYPERQEHLCACEISAKQLESTLSNMSELPCAVYVTSPDYLGNMLDISSLSAVCREYGQPLLVDNAHGAYLKFLEKDLHPITLGAAMCADSAHKTLPVLTGGAYLHISKDFPGYATNARKALSLFASTSPSYLTLSSLDLCNRELAEGFVDNLTKICAAVEALKFEIKDNGFCIEDSEPLKIVINAKKSGTTTEKIAKALRSSNIEPEFVDNEYVVLMPSAETKQDDLEKTLNALKKVDTSSKNNFENANLFPKTHEKVMSIREAIFAESKRVKTDEAEGKICAAPTVSCPPAVPIVVSGERITKADIELFKFYGVNDIDVVKE